MKISEKYFKKIWFHYPQMGKYIETYGEICRLEGKIFATNSYGTDNHLKDVLPKLKDILKKIIRNNEL